MQEKSRAIWDSVTLTFNLRNDSAKSTRAWGQVVVPFTGIYVRVERHHQSTDSQLNI